MEKEITISKNPFSLYDSQIYNDCIYIFSDDSDVVIFNNLDEEPTTLKLKQHEAFLRKKQDERGIVSGVQYVGNTVFVLYDYVKNAPIDRVREIRKYDLGNGNEDKIIPLKYKSSKEMIRFFTIN
ncbi:hypothetical protein [Paenibacillus sp. GCM10012306]|uniref:hypothetical protein n=1 Tax=Paenibacillus sp. GCM10012306 TaxID=3317342 RepID=UPI0036D316B0